MNVFFQLNEFKIIYQLGYVMNLQRYQYFGSGYVNSSYKKIEFQRIRGERITKIIMNDDLTFFNTNNDCVYTKLNTHNNTTLVNYEYFSNQRTPKIVSKGVSNSHIFIVTKADELYGCGNNEYCQLGFMNTNTRHTYKYKLLNENIPFNISDLVSIKCGKNHSIFLDRHGLCFGCGIDSHGQLGFIDQLETKSAIIITKIAPMSHLSNIKQIDCNDNTTLALSKDNIFFINGENNYSQLGNSQINGYHINILTNFNDDNIIITDFCSGKHHTLCLTNKGVLYCFGRNHCYQSGIFSTTNNISKPTIIHNNITSIKTYENHNIIKQSNNKYISFGNNYYYECLWYKESLKSFVTHKIDDFIQINIKQIIKRINVNDNKLMDIIPGLNTNYLLFK